MSLVIICISTSYLQSQSVIGTYGNYVGSDGALLNPASLMTSNVYADFGLSLNASAYNDYFHVKSKDLLNAVADKKYTASYTKTINGLPRLFDVDFDYGSNKPVSANVNVDALIFSGMYNFKNKFVLGFFARARSNVNVKKIPNSIVEIAIVGFDHSYSVGDGLFGIDTVIHYNQYARDYSNKNTDIGFMAWSELGVSYSKNIMNYGFERVDFGINAKLELAAGVAALSAEQFDYHLDLGEDGAVNDSLWFVDDIKGKMVYSLPVSYDVPFVNNGKINQNLFGKYINGYGLGFDIGVTYTSNRIADHKRSILNSCQIKPIDYQYRIGVSLLDIGAVYFGGNNAEIMDVNAANSVINTSGFTNVKTVHDFVNVLSDSLGAKTQKEGFWMGLPTAVSLQFDYSFNPHWFINAVVVQPVKFFRHHVTRDAQLLLSPRYESTYFDFALPVTLLNYNRVLLGASARFAFLTIGTQNILNLIGCGETYGLDIYVSLKFNFNKGRCYIDKGCLWNSDFGYSKRRL